MLFSVRSSSKWQWANVMIDEREPWTISWHIFLQNAVYYLTMEKMACRVIKINRVEAVNQAIGRANALVTRHGPLGSSALNAAAHSLAALADMASNGTAPVVVTTSDDATH